MDLQQIKYFLAVVDYGTFLAAAEQVHVSQPTLSAGIRKLEESLNVTLFERGSRLASLTPAGELFLKQARPSFNRLMSIKDQLCSGAEYVKLGILNSIPMEHLAEVIRHYKAVKPHVYFELTVGNSETLSRLLQSQKLELIITTEKRQGEKFSLLFEETLHVAVAEQHSFASESSLELKQLSGQAFIERVCCESWHEVHDAFQKQNIQPYSVCRAESDESVLSLVAANLGVSIMPARNTPYAVKFVPIKDLEIVRPIGVSSLNRQMPAHVECLYESIVKLYAKQVR